MYQVGRINFLSWNCRGLGKLKNIKQVMHRIKQLHVTVAFLQETHISKEDVVKIERRWRGQVFSVCYNTQARGVIILIHKSVPFQVQNIIKDPAGRFVIIQGELLAERINLLNIHGPNKDDPKFYSNIFLLVSTQQGQNIIAGDINCTLDPEMDRSTGVDTTHLCSRKTFYERAQPIGYMETS